VVRHLNGGQMMKQNTALLVSCLLFAFTIFCTCTNTPEGKNFVQLNPDDTPADIIRKAANVTPSPQQFAWQQMEFIAFVHFTVNTFTDMEWGHGDEDPAIFNPSELDTRQWAKICKEIGMKQIIITTKHHDGFCLWPSKYTEHSVKNSPWKDGKGDVVGEVAQACQEEGLKFGIYLSPWDRHEPSYGDSPTYNEFLRNQLRELLTNYGEICEVWFDGACGEGPNGKKQVYDWESYYRLIRELQPNAVIAIVGPDVRWVGTESGYGRETEWSVVPATEFDQEKIAENSQQKAGSGIFRPQIDAMAADLGSREKLKKASALVWYPSEVDVSIRPGWFYHASQDERVKTPEKLIDIYYSSVGYNSVLLLNLPPDRRGLIHENDVRSLRQMKIALDATFKTNLAANAKLIASNTRSGYDVAATIDQDKGCHLDTYWITSEGVDSATIVFEFEKPQIFDRALVQENIRIGQRIEAFMIEAWDGVAWQPITGGTTVGYKRLLRFPVATASKIRLTISQSRTSPTLANFGLFKAPPSLKIEPSSSAFVEQIEVKLTSDLKGSQIYFTLDGSLPTESSTAYSSEGRTAPITLTESTTLKAIAIHPQYGPSFIKTAQFNRAKHGIKLNTAFSQKYSAGGALALIDDVLGTRNFGDNKWQGYAGNNLDAIVDLGKLESINKISVGFLQNIKYRIFFPTRVEFSLSKDGKYFFDNPVQNNQVPVTDTGGLVQTFSINPDQTSARYIWVKAKNIGVCPEGHPNSGEKAWLFVDEIIIE